MSLRNSINQNPVLATVVAIAVFVFALGFGYRQLRRMFSMYSPQSMAAYYYDLASGHLFVDDASKRAPIEAPSGPLDVQGVAQPAGVLAHIVACGKCPRNLDGKTAKEVAEAGATILYLQDYGGTTTGSGDFHIAGMRVGRVPNVLGQVPKFFDRQSPRAQRLLIDVDRDCPDGQRPVTCKP